MTLPEPKNLEHHLGQLVYRRKANIFKLFYKFETIPNIYQLSAGLPNENLFPVSKIQAKAANLNTGTEEPLHDISLVPDAGRMAAAMQYGQASGIPEMRDWIEDFTSRMFECKYAGGFGTMVSLGTTDGWYKTLQVLSDEWLERHPAEWRQGLITEEFTYSLAAEAARVRGLNIVPVSMDGEGLKPEVLDSVLANWDKSKGQRPHILYTVSIGQNPTGATAGPERRKQIYEICQKYDIIIVEDEPYWFLQFDGRHEKCYLDIDTDGRVVRLDSFSKNFVPGGRIGWITGQPNLIRRIYQLAEEATQQPSGFTQLLVLEALNRWGHEGWLQWLSNLKDEYQSRRDIMVKAIEKYKSIDDKLVLDFKSPAAGMFVWIHVQFQLHPLAKQFSISELSKAFWAFHATHKQPVLITPGYFFAPSQTDVEHLSSYIRLSFAPSEKQNLERESEGFGRNSLEFWQIKDPEQIRALIEQFPM